MSDYQHIIESFTFIMGTKGAYEVEINDELVFSKKQLGRHAEPGEVLSIFEGKLGPDVTKYPKKG